MCVDLTLDPVRDSQNEIQSRLLWISSGSEYTEGWGASEQSQYTEQELPKAQVWNTQLVRTKQVSLDTDEYEILPARLVTRQTAT